MIDEEMRRRGYLTIGYPKTGSTQGTAHRSFGAYEQAAFFT